MLVQRILKFLKDLKDHGTLSDCDAQLYKTLFERFSGIHSTKILTSDDVDFVVHCFSLRWKVIIDDKNGDYTLNPIGVNLVWIELAKEFSSLTNRNYLYLLIPTVGNTVDYNNLSLLSETVNPENLYLGSDNTTVYRKRGLCEHLIKERFRLSTCRDLHTRTLSPFSIVELSRLQSCTQPHGEFSINETEHFTSFWDFLEKKTFIRLQAAGKLPSDDLPVFQNVIMKFYLFQKERIHFRIFKQIYQDFLDRLSHHELDNVNFFYGVRITYNGKEHYMLDLLISIYQSETYDITAQIVALNEWLRGNAKYVRV